MLDSGDAYSDASIQTFLRHVGPFRWNSAKLPDDEDRRHLSHRGFGGSVEHLETKREGGVNIVDDRPERAVTDLLGIDANAMTHSGSVWLHKLESCRLWPMVRQRASIVYEICQSRSRTTKTPGSSCLGMHAPVSAMSMLYDCGRNL